MVEISKITCPICGKGEISVIKRPSVLQIKSTRGSGQSGKLTYRTEATEGITSDCSECGAKKKTIQQVWDGKLSAEVAKERIGKKRCSFCKEYFEGKGKLCPECAEFED